MKTVAMLVDAVDLHMRKAAALRQQGDIRGAWQSLSEAHVISQPLLSPHLKVHLTMLGLAVATRNLPEMSGQILRILLAPLGNLSGRLPWGNSGLSDVSPFKPAPLSADVQALFAQAGIEVTHA